MNQGDLREYRAEARSTDAFGRVLCNAREHPVRDDLTVFNRVRMRFEIAGVDDGQAASLVERVGRCCPLYGSVAASAGDLEVEIAT
jgi:hypothetical protein